jgi:hypothetical protein
MLYVRSFGLLYCYIVMWVLLLLISAHLQGGGRHGGAHCVRALYVAHSFIHCFLPSIPLSALLQAHLSSGLARLPRHML